MFDGPLPRRAPRPALVADLFCGAGGSSTGARRALDAIGRPMTLVCVNHWDRAIETHSRNHPTARHYCQDVASVRPLAVVPEGRLDLLMASPTCTYHSRARGGRPTSDQQRMDPWHVVTWLTELRVKRLIIENVPEFVEWGPVNLTTGKPLKSRKGQYFRQWIAAIEGLGFRVEWRILNCADYGDATTRQRFFLLARSDGKRISWPMPTHSRDGRPDMFGAGAQRWRPAREIIDWSLKGRSIFNRKKPLSPKTLMRIHAGAVKLRWPEPFLVVLRQHMGARGIDLPIPTIAANGNHIGLAEPVLLRTAMHKSNAACVRLLDQPLPTITTDDGLAVAQPFVLAQAGGGVARPLTEPVPTITTGGNGGAHALIAPYYGSGSGESGKSVDEPLDTVTAKPRFGLAEPILLPQRDHQPPRGLDEPLTTITTVARIGMVVPITHSDGSNRARDVKAPLPTLTCANRGELAFITPAFGEREGQAPRLHDVAAPVPTICAKGRINLVEPAVINMKGRSDASSVEQPAPTITAHARHLAVAEAGPDGRFDILFRMLEPHELAAAMSFSGDDYAYEFAGTKTEITRQIGNAVPVRTAQALVSALFMEKA